MGGKQRLARGLVKRFSPVKETVNPRKELAGAVVRVEHDWHPIGRGQFVHVVGGGYTAEHLGLLIVQLQGFAGIEGGPSVGQLHDDGRPHGGCRLQRGIEGIGANDVDSREGVPPGLGIVEQGGDLFSVKNAGTESGHGAVSLGLQGAKVHVTLRPPGLSHPLFQGLCPGLQGRGSSCPCSRARMNCSSLKVNHLLASIAMSDQAVPGCRRITSA